MHSLQRPKSSGCTVSNKGDRLRAAKRQTFLLDHIQTDHAEIADILLHEIRDVVVAHEQHVERHVLAVAHELVFAAAVLEPAARQQIERGIGEPAALLHGDLEPHGTRRLVHACELQPIGHCAIAAVARLQVARDAADGGHTHAGLPVDFAIGQAALEELDHGPAIGHGLQLGRRAKVAKKTAAFLDAAQRQNRRAKGALVLLFLPLGHWAVGFHESAVLVLM